MVEFYLMRHGIAAPGRVDDAARELTPEGIVGVQMSVQKVPKALDWVASSPLVRARQTAEILAAHLSPPTAVESWVELAPGGNATAVCARLTLLGGRGAVVSHQPLVSVLLSLLTGSDVFLEPGTVACITGESLSPGFCELMWIEGM